MPTHIDGINTTEWGHGPRVVFIHGGGPGGAMSFAAQKPLAERWHLVLPDRPGHGDSPRQGRDDFERDADLLAPTLDDGAHVVGHSYGAIVALVLALRHPQSIRSLTLIEPPAFGLAPEDPDVAAVLEANRQLVAHPPEDLSERLRQFWALVGIDGTVPDPLPQALARGAEEMMNVRGPDEAEIDAEALGSAKFSILVLTSGRLPVFEKIAAGFVVRAGARHTIVPGTDHAVQDAGGPVNDLLEQFWLSVPPRSPGIRPQESGA
jgi:pimeloyl-ACP methyl ester carboxylesterase